MDISTELLVLLFSDETKAGEVLKAMQRLIDEGCVSILDMAVLAKDKDGRTVIKDIQEVDAAHGALFGAITGGLIGLVGGPLGTVVGALAGATAGGVAAQAIDSGFPDAYLQELQANLPLSNSALIILTRQGCGDRVVEALAQFQGRLIRHVLKDDLAAYLAALAVLDSDQAPTAELAAKLEEQVAAWQTDIETLQVKMATGGAAKTRPQFVNLRTRQRRAQEKLHELWAAEIEALTEQIEALGVEIETARPEAKTRLVAQIETTRAKRRVVREKLYAQLEARIKSWQSEIEELKTRVAEIEAAIKILPNPRVAALQRFASAFDDPVLPTTEAEAKARIAVLQARAETTEKELQNLYETQIAAWQSTIKDLQAYQTISDIADKSAVAERMAVLQDQIVAAQAKLKTQLEAQITRWRAEIDELQADEAIAQKVKIDTQIAALQAQIADLQAQAVTIGLTDKVRAAEQIATLQAKIEAAQAKLQAQKRV